MYISQVIDKVILLSRKMFPTEHTLSYVVRHQVEITLLWIPPVNKFPFPQSTY